MLHVANAKLSSHPGYLVAALFSQPDGSDARMGSFITGFQAGKTQGDVWGFPVGLASLGRAQRRGGALGHGCLYLPPARW